jgi:hypothetical protein
MTDAIERPVILNASPRELRRYKDDYIRGWKARGTSVMLRADRRQERHAWYDGHADKADGLEKWHRLYCPDHDACALGYTEDHEFREYAQQQTAELIRHMRWQHGLGPMTAAEMKAAYADASALRADHKASRCHAGYPA